MTETFTAVGPYRFAKLALTVVMPFGTNVNRSFVWNLGHWDLPFDLAQGGESFDFAQDREPVERLVEPFEIWVLVLGIFIQAT